jgi:hypothetical protein
MPASVPPPPLEPIPPSSPPLLEPLLVLLEVEPELVLLPLELLELDSPELDPLLLDDVELLLELPLDEEPVLSGLLVDEHPATGPTNVAETTTYEMAFIDGFLFPACPTSVDDGSDLSRPWIRIHISEYKLILRLEGRRASVHVDAARSGQRATSRPDSCSLVVLFGLSGTRTLGLRKTSSRRSRPRLPVIANENRKPDRRPADHVA